MTDGKSQQSFGLEEQFPPSILVLWACVESGENKLSGHSALNKTHLSGLRGFDLLKGTPHSGLDRLAFFDAAVVVDGLVRFSAQDATSLSAPGI